jgi:hypothetical protein
MPFKDRNNPRNRYNQHRFNAKKVGTPFQLTFDEWWQMWSSSGHWHERGRHRGQYVMARFGDQGPYAVGNVAIVEHEQNDREASFHPRSDEWRRKNRSILLQRNSGTKQRDISSAFAQSRNRDEAGRFL